MSPLNDQYKPNKHPIAVIFVIYREESKAKRKIAIDGHVNYICMVQNLSSSGNIHVCK